MTTFPISLSANWQCNSATNDLSHVEREWLCEPGSLTAKLKSRAHSFSVKVLQEQAFELTSEQKALLECDTQSALNREVILYCDEMPMVYAQSWLPDTQFKNTLHNMGERPLGDVIFQHSELVRNNIEIACFDLHHPIQHLTKDLKLILKPLLGRRSVFSLNNYNFLVCEVFLPGAYIYL